MSHKMKDVGIRDWKVLNAINMTLEVLRYVENKTSSSQNVDH